MHPTLLRLGDFSLHTYGVAMAAGYLAAVLLGMHSARRQGLSSERLLDLSFWILAASLFGSRLLFVLTQARSYYHQCVDGAGPGPRSATRLLLDCTRPVHLWEGGFVFFGGFVAASLVTLWYARHHQLSFLKLADFLAPLLALGHFFGRLGCFAAGCCYGKPTAAPWGLTFPRSSLAYQELLQLGLLAPHASSTLPLHPTQLYEAAAELAIFFILVLALPRRRYTGQGLVLYLALYSLARFVLEVWRDDADRGFLFRCVVPLLNHALGLAPDAPTVLSTSQLLSLLGLAAALLLRVALCSAATRPARGP